MASSPLPGPLVETDWLADHLDDPDLRVIDASIPLLGQTDDMRTLFKESAIPGSVFFDINDIADPESNLPHMMPNVGIFTAKVGILGISNDSTIIAYDRHGVYSSPRAWWMFRAFGHDRVAVLNGGLPKWLEEGRPEAPGGDTGKRAEFSAQLRPGLLRLVEQMQENIDSGSEQVVDARAEARFMAREPEIRPGLRGGHIPHSLNVPFPEILAYGRMIDTAEIKAAFDAGGVDLTKPIVTSCGSGITACILALGLHLCGHENAAVYDGSWTEWGSREDLPAES